MAYVPPIYFNGLTSGAASGADGLWDTMDAAIVAAGWTRVYLNATRDQVYQAPNYSATMAWAPFVRMFSNGNYSGSRLNFNAMLDYDSTTHTQLSAASQAGAETYATAYPSTANYSCIYRTNQWAVCAAFGNLGGQCSVLYMGWWRSNLPSNMQGCCIIPGALTSGSTTITTGTDLRGSLTVGQPVYILNYSHNSASANAGKMEQRVISAITATTITFTAGLTNNYDAGAALVNSGMNFSASGNSNVGGTQFSITPAWLWGSDVTSPRPNYGANSYSNASGQPNFASDCLQGLAALGTGGALGFGNLYPSFNAGTEITGANSSMVEGGNAHHIIAIAVETAKTAPAHWTDGVSVFDTLSTVEASQTYWALGPTGATPAWSSSTQPLIIPPQKGYADSASIYPPPVTPGASPINQFNQGLN